MSAALLLAAILVAGYAETSEATCKRPLDIAMIIDGSSSICKVAEPCPEWNAIIRFVKSIVGSFKIGLDDSRIACVTLSDEAHMEWGLTEHTSKKSLSLALDNVVNPGGELTDLFSLHDVLAEIFNDTDGDRSEADNVVILITDGIPKFPPIIYTVVSSFLQIVGSIEVFVVCIAPGCTEQCARGMASMPHQINENYFLVKDSLSIGKVTVNLVQQICAI